MDDVATAEPDVGHFVSAVFGCTALRLEPGRLPDRILVFQPVLLAVSFRVRRMVRARWLHRGEAIYPVARVALARQRLPAVCAYHDDGGTISRDRSHATSHGSTMRSIPMTKPTSHPTDWSTSSFLPFSSTGSCRVTGGASNGRFSGRSSSAANNRSRSSVSVSSSRWEPTLCLSKFPTRSGCKSQLVSSVSHC